MGDFLLPCPFVCRQEVMDLVDKSGKFSKKFERFTGTPPTNIYIYKEPQNHGLLFTVILLKAQVLFTFTS